MLEFARRRFAPIGLVAALAPFAQPTPSTGTWLLTPMGQPAGISTTTSGASCWSGQACFAVGTAFTTTSGERPVIWRLNSNAWLPPMSMPTSQQQAWLNGVSCAGTGTGTRCVAVGGAGNLLGSTTIPYGLYWDRKWMGMSSPALPAGTSASFNGVACASPTFCMAVGFDRSATVAASPVTATLNRFNWILQPITPPAGATSSTLINVSCVVGKPECVALGQAQVHGETEAFWSWFLGHWSPTPKVISVPGSTDTTLRSVSCLPGVFPYACMATGQAQIGTSATPFMVGLSPTGKVVTPFYRVAVPGSTFAALNGISCPIGTWCMSAGNKTVSGRSEVFMYSWDTSSRLQDWKGEITPAPNPSGSSNAITSISCASASACNAVGTSSRGVTTSGIRALGERYKKPAPPKKPRKT